jgi:large subunit ribosomal protein L6
MSRIGKMPVPIPKGVTVTVSDSITVKGPKGQLSRPLVAGVSAEIVGEELIIRRDGDEKMHRANHGLMRALAFNMVMGVTQGFSKTLEIVGVGYKAESRGKNLVLSLGHSHDITYKLPDGIEVKVDKGKQIMGGHRIENYLIVSGIDKEQVGQAAAVIRGYRKPDSYKGKGVRYTGERIRLKAGKAAKSA